MDKKFEISYLDEMAASA